MAKQRSHQDRKTSSASTPATVHLDIEPSEVPETTTARSLGQEKSGASEPPSQLGAQVDPATAVTSFHSQDPAIQPTSEASFRQKNVVPEKAAFRKPEDAEHTSDEEDYDAETTTADTVSPAWEIPRAEEESFRSYATRRGRSFGYPNLRDQQLDALEKLVEYKTDVMLVAKTSFGKSLIFQLAPLLMPDPAEPGIVLILMPLTLLQQNQAENVIKRGAHLGAKCIVLDQDSNDPRNRRLIAEGKYTHIFTSPEVINDTPFREDVTNAPRFREKLCCIAIDEVHLVDEWKDFRNEYARIGWFRQALPRHIPLFAASATLGPIVRERVRRSCNFRESFCLIETSIDREEIFIGTYTMDRTRKSFLDLSGILPKVAVTGEEIPKTVVFIDSITEIQALRRTILNWMRRLNYPVQKCQRWVKTYFASMAKASKTSIAADFGTLNEAKEGLVSPSCRILIATTAYGLGIDNPDIEEVIVWGLPHSMADALQRLGRAMRNGKGQAVARIFIPKWCVGPRTLDSKSQSSLSQSQSVDDSDHVPADEDGDLSDGVSVVDDRDAYIVEADTGGKIKLTARARRERMKAALYRLANNPCDECIRTMMLQEMGDATYPSKEKPKLCCSACQPDEYKLEINEALLPVKIPRNNVHLFFAESRLTEWRAAQIISEPEDSIYSLVPATFMPDEVIKALTLRWKLIKETPLLESLEYVRQGCQCWAECEEYVTAIQTFMRGEMRSTWDTTYWHNEYSRQRWSDKKPKQVQKSKAAAKREEKREEKRLLLASNKQPKTKQKTALSGKTAVERLGGRLSGHQLISNDDETRHEKMIRKPKKDKQLRSMSGQFTSQANHPAATMTLSPRKDILKRAKSPAPPACTSLTRIPRAGRSTTRIRSSASMSPMAPDDTHPPSPPLVHGTSRAGRVQSPSQKKAYNNS